MAKPAIAILALATLLLTGCGGATAADEIQIPGVGDMTLAEAETALVEAGIEDFTVDPGPQSNPQDDWIVTSTRPVGGNLLGEGDSITLMVRSEEFLEQSAADAAKLVEAREAAAAEAEAKRQAAAKKAAEEARKAAAAEAKAKAKAEAKARAEALKPIVYEGYGADVIRIEKKDVGAQPARISHTGYSNFVVKTLDSSLEMTDLLVNTIGNYSGTVLFDDGFGGDGSETETLEIMADGAWKIELLPLEAMESFNGSKTISGTGDSVFYYTGDSGIATVNYNGSSNIVVLKHGFDTDLAVNEIGPYQGTVVLQSGLIEVKTEGAWTIEFE